VAAAASGYPARLKVVLVGVPLAGIVLAAAAAIHGGFTGPQQWRWLVLPAVVVGSLLAEMYPVKIGPEQKVNLGALPSLVAALLLPPGVGPATAALSVLAGNRLVGRTWW